MASKEPLDLEFKYDPAGKDLLIYLVCSGIATGSYACRINMTDGSTANKEGNIEKPERYKFPAASGPKSMQVNIVSKPFFDAEPGTYHLVFQQEGQREQESPELVDDAELSIRFSPGKP